MRPALRVEGRAATVSVAASPSVPSAMLGSLYLDSSFFTTSFTPMSVFEFPYSVTLRSAPSFSFSGIRSYASVPFLQNISEPSAPRYIALTSVPRKVLCPAYEAAARACSSFPAATSCRPSRVNPIDTKDTRPVRSSPRYAAAVQTFPRAVSFAPYLCLNTMDRAIGMNAASEPTAHIALHTVVATRAFHPTVGENHIAISPTSSIIRPRSGKRTLHLRHV